MKTKGSANSFDIHIGQRVQLYRKAKKLTRKELADQLGITYQQLQKYESGTNRIGAGRLYSIACILGINISILFNEIEDKEASIKSPAPLTDMQKRMYTKETTNLLTAYYSLPDKSTRTTIINFINSFNKR